MIRTYETVLVFDGVLSDDELGKQVDSFRELVSEGGEVVRVDTWGRRDLAFPLKNRRTGYYVLVVHKSGPGTPGRITQGLRLNEKVLRHLTVVADEKAAEPRPVEQAVVSEAVEEGEPAGSEE